MKVILSRKGFDSSYGGHPSPILPNGDLLSLPIPSPGDKICYSDLQYNENLTYFDIMKQLKGTIRIPNHTHDPTSKLSEKTECHLDPDLDKSLIRRDEMWRPIFGQINQAQSHLENQNVGEGDLFLFFGWFRQTEWINGELQFKRNVSDLHIIHGYLQIDKILQPRELTEIPHWMKYHPHVTNQDRLQKRTNTLYIAREKLSWDTKIPGAGLLKYGTKHILTKEKRTRSIWKLPRFFQGLNITYHSGKSWNVDGTLNSARIGQEFVIEENKMVEKWARSIIEQ